MRNTSVLLLFVLTFLSGCQNPEKAVEVIIEGGGRFPAEMAGTWRSKKPFWEIVFEEDGQISSVVVNMGRVRMTPGEVTNFKTWNYDMAEEWQGGIGIFAPGDWQVTYDPDARFLTVSIEVSDFYQDLGPNAVMGDLLDTLSGVVSEDFQTWEADWFNQGTYIAITPEMGEQELPTEPEGEWKGIVQLRKVSEEEE